MCKTNHFRSAAVAIVFVGAFGLLGAACESPEDVNGPAYVRVVHLANSVGAVDIHADGGYSFDIGSGYGRTPAVGADEVKTIVAQGLTYRSSTDYVPVLPGAALLEARSAGIPYGEPLLTIDAELSSGLHYTIVVLETQAGPSTLLMNDEEWDGQGTAARFVHAAESLPGVDLWVIPASGEAQRIANRLSSGQAVGYFAVENGARLGLDANRDGAPDAQFEVSQVSKGKTVSLFAVSTAGTLTLLVQGSAGELSILPAL